MIEVHIPYSLFDRLGHDTLIGSVLCEALKKAGIPALGGTCLYGVKTGYLTYIPDDHGQQRVFRWRADDTDTETKFRCVMRAATAVGDKKFSAFYSGPHLAAYEDDDL